MCYNQNGLRELYRNPEGGCNKQQYQGKTPFNREEPAPADGQLDNSGGEGQMGWGEGRTEKGEQAHIVNMQKH